MSENPFAVSINKRSFHRTEWNVIHTPTHTVVATHGTVQEANEDMYQRYRAFVLRCQRERCVQGRFDTVPGVSTSPM